MKLTYLYGILLLVLSACETKVEEKKPIVIGDSTTIVTEQNEFYRQNNTKDISPTNKNSSEKQIHTMMVQVDSMQSAKKLEEVSASSQKTALRGFTINFTECDIVFDGLSAHAINERQNERTSNSVAYVVDGGNISEMLVQIQTLTEVKAEQRLFTKLFIELENEIVELQDLGKYISSWTTLQGKENKFVSLNIGNTQFFEVTHEKLVNALDRELRKKKKNKQVLQSGMTLLKNTKNYSDSPCLVKVVSSQWRIIGKADGKRVQKLIQFDIPLR